MDNTKREQVKDRSVVEVRLGQLLILLVTFVVVGLWLRERNLQETLVKQGVTASAVFIECVPGRESDRLRYEFEAENPDTLRLQMYVGQESGWDVSCPPAEGIAIPIYYLKGNPERVRIVGNSSLHFA